MRTWALALMMIPLQVYSEETLLGAGVRNRPEFDGSADQTTDPAHEHDDPRFGWVTIKRPGAEPTLHKVRKEP